MDAPRAQPSGAGNRDLHALCREGKLEELKKLLRHSPNIDARKGSHGLTALHEACSYDRPAVCAELLSYGAEFNETTTEGRYSALHLASHHHHYRCIEVLLLHSKKRLDLKMTNTDGKTALQLAQARNFRDVVRIIRCGEIYQLSKDHTAVDRVRHLLEKLQTTERINGACTPATEEVVHNLIDQSLLDAARSNNQKLVGFLLQFGIQRGDTLLTAHKAAKNAGYLEVAAILILAYRTFAHDTEIVRYLLAPQLEVEHNDFLVIGPRQDRDLVFPLHEKKAINSSIAMRVALQHNFLDTAGCILRSTDCCTSTGVVDWHGLGLTFLVDDWVVDDVCIFRSVAGTVHTTRLTGGDWVTSLNLSRNFLTEVPKIVGRLKHLTKLDLSENPIGSPPTSGPYEQGDKPTLPVEIFGLKTLKKLNLSKIRLAKFPEVTEWSSSLTELNLAGNYLTTLPPSFGGARELVSLNLESNKLDRVPRCIGNLIKLVSLNISCNIGITELPHELGRLSQLITLEHKQINFNHIPDALQGRPGAIVRYLNRQLRHLESQRVAKIIVVGQNRQLRRLLVEQLIACPSCPTGLLDFGNLETFFLFMRVIDPRHCHFILVWDIDGGESLDDLLIFFMYLRKKVRLPEGVRHNPGSSRFHVLLAAVQATESSYDDTKARVNEVLGDYALDELMPVRPKPIIMNLSEAHRRRASQDLLTRLEDLNLPYITIPEVPHSHVDACNRLSLNLKKKLHGALDETAWMVEEKDILIKMNSLMKVKANEIADSNTEELKALLSYLQHDGNILNIRYPGSAFDDIYFFTPQWLFRSLHDAFGPTTPLPIRFRSFAAGLYNTSVLSWKKMFGSGSCRAKLAHFALPLAVYFGLAYPVTDEIIFLPLKLPRELSLNDSIRLLSAVHMPDNLYRFMSSGKQTQSQYLPWPNGFFQLLQSYIMDVIGELFEDTCVNEPVSFTEAQRWLPGLDRADAPSGIGPGARRSSRVEISSDCTLTLWQHGIAAWNGQQLVFAVFQKSALPQAFHCVHLCDTGTLCIVVPSRGRAGVCRLATLVDIVLLLLDEVFADDIFPFLVDRGAGATSGINQYVPCQDCHRGVQGIPDDSWYLYNVSDAISAYSTKNMSRLEVCPLHTKSLSSWLRLEELAPDILLKDVNIRYRFTEDEIDMTPDRKAGSTVLGKGGFASIKLAFCEDRMVACKQYDPTHDVLSAYRDLRREIAVLSMFSLHHDKGGSSEDDGTDGMDATFNCYEPGQHHPASNFFITLFGVCLSPLMLLMEVAPHGSLNDLLIDHHPELSRPYLAAVACEVTAGMHALHSAGIVCRDIKAGNILVFSKGLRDDVHVKLTDFGTAVLVPQSGIVKVIGTRNYQAPETQLENVRPRYSYAVDVFAFGLFLYELLTGKKAFGDVITGPIMAAIRAGKRPNVNDASYGSRLLTSAATSCWQAKVNARPTSTSLHRHLTQPESLLAIDYIQFDIETSVRHVMVVPPPVADFGRSQYLLTVFRDSRPSTVIRMEPIHGTHSQDILHSSFPDIESQQLPPQELVLEGAKVISVCLSQLSHRLWIGTEKKRIFVINYSSKELVRDDSTITVPAKPLTMVAGVSRVFVGLEDGYVLAFPRDRSQAFQSRSRDCRAKKLADCAVVSIVSVYDSRLWCLSLDGDVHVLMVGRRVEREHVIRAADKWQGAKGLAIVHAASLKQVWVVFRDSFKLACWPDDLTQGARLNNDDEVEDDSPLLVADMQRDWEAVVKEAMPLVAPNFQYHLDKKVIRPRSVVIQEGVMWIGTSAGIALLYELFSPPRQTARTGMSFRRRHRDEAQQESEPSNAEQRNHNDNSTYRPKFIGWLYMHDGPNSLLTSAYVNSAGFSRQVVISGGTGSPLFNRNGCHSLNWDKKKKKKMHATLDRSRGFFTASQRTHRSSSSSSNDNNFGADDQDGIFDIAHSTPRMEFSQPAMPVSVNPAESFVNDSSVAAGPQWSLRQRTPPLSTFGGQSNRPLSPVMWSTYSPGPQDGVESPSYLESPPVTGAVARAFDPNRSSLAGPFGSSISAPYGDGLGQFDIEPIDTSDAMPKAEDYADDVIEGVVIPGLPGSGGMVLPESDRPCEQVSSSSAQASNTTLQAARAATSAVKGDTGAANGARDVDCPDGVAFIDNYYATASRRSTGEKPSVQIGEVTLHQSAARCDVATSPAPLPANVEEDNSPPAESAENGSEPITPSEMSVPGQAAAFVDDALPSIMDGIRDSTAPTASDHSQHNQVSSSSTAPQPSTLDKEPSERNGHVVQTPGNQAAGRRPTLSAIGPCSAFSEETERQNKTTSEEHPNLPAMSQDTAEGVVQDGGALTDRVSLPASERGSPVSSDVQPAASTSPPEADNQLEGTIPSAVAATGRELDQAGSTTDVCVAAANGTDHADSPADQAADDSNTLQLPHHAGMESTVELRTVVAKALAAGLSNDGEGATHDIHPSSTQYRSHTRRSTGLRLVTDASDANDTRSFGSQDGMSTSPRGRFTRRHSSNSNVTVPPGGRSMHRGSAGLQIAESNVRQSSEMASSDQCTYYVPLSPVDAKEALAGGADTTTENTADNDVEEEAINRSQGKECESVVSTEVCDFVILNTDPNFRSDGIAERDQDGISGTIRFGIKPKAGKRRVKPLLMTSIDSATEEESGEDELDTSSAEQTEVEASQGGASDSQPIESLKSTSVVTEGDFVLLQQLQPCVLFWESCSADELRMLFSTSRRCREPFSGSASWRS